MPLYSFNDNLGDVIEFSFSLNPGGGGTWDFGAGGDVGPNGQSLAIYLYKTCQMYVDNNTAGIQNFTDAVTTAIFDQATANPALLPPGLSSLGPAAVRSWAAGIAAVNTSPQNFFGSMCKIAPYIASIDSGTPTELSIVQVGTGGTPDEGQYLSSGVLLASITVNPAQTDDDLLTLGDVNEKIKLQASSDPNLTTIDAEDDANYVIADNNVNVTIDLGSGKNIVGHVGEGAIVNANGGTQDRFVMSNDELITGSTPTDQIFSAGGILLKGAVGQIGSSDPWIVGPDGTKYGFNQQGDLVIQDLLGNDTYVSGYQGGPGVDYSQQTDSIFVGLSQGQAQMLLDLERPFMSYISTIFKVGQEILYTKSGLKFFNVDPLCSISPATASISRR